MAGSAAVGIRQTADASLTAGGTFSSTPRKPTDAGGSILQTYGENDLNVATTMQGATAYNPFQEVNLFIGEMANKLGVSPKAAAARIVDLCRAFQTQTFN